MKGEVIGIATFQFIEGQNLNFAIPSERIANLDLIGEEKTFTTEELFKQEEKDKKDSGYFLIALMDVLYFLSEKEYEKALPCLEIVIQSEPAFAYFGIGYCYGILGNITKSIEAFEKADHIDNVCVDCNLVGWGYSMLSNYTKAIEAYKQAIRIDPEDARGYRNLGFTYNSLGLYKDAIEAFKQAIRINPEYADAHFGLGFSYFLIGDKSSALDEYKILKELDIDKANELFDIIY
jgi:tetratricopeptide (TPR) repeat protein